MKIDLSCPAEVRRYELPKEGYPACDLTMHNLSNRVIISVEVTLILFEKGKEQAHLTYRAHDLRGNPGESFTMPVPVAEDCHASEAEAVIEKVWYDDNSIWRRGKGPLTEYTPNALPNSRSLETLRYVAGADAVGYPQEQDGAWLCVCGRPNQKSASSCVRCHREKDQVFIQFNREAIEKKAGQREQQLNLKAKAAREDASRLQLQREKEYQEKKKKRRRMIGVIVGIAACLCAVYGVVFHYLPYLNYKGAVEKMEAGNWQEAQAAFAGMGDYRDAEEMIRRCQYMAAKENLNSGDEAVIAAAKEALLSLGDYEDAAALTVEADYARATVLMDSGRAEEASQLFASLGDYKDSAEKVNACAFMAADKLLEAGEYDKARAAFEALGDYEGAAEKIKQSIYLPGKKAVEEGDADTALALLSQVAGYEDADELTLAAHYLKGQALQDAGSMAEAGEEYLLAGDYQDAAEKANACIYAPASEALNQGDVIRAAELFGKIKGYQDATEQWQLSMYKQAQTAMKDTEYAMARNLLGELPDDYEDVAALRQECTYLAAKASANRGEYQAAVDAFAQLGEYKNSAALLLDARYKLAESKAEGGDYAGAIADFQSLGDYRDSKKRASQTSYQEPALISASASWGNSSCR